jgi:hypothetical protein
LPLFGERKQLFFMVFEIGTLKEFVAFGKFMYYDGSF